MHICFYLNVIVRHNIQAKKPTDDLFIFWGCQVHNFFFRWKVCKIFGLCGVKGEEEKDKIVHQPTMIWFINLIWGEYTLSKLHFHFWISPCTFVEPHLENSRSERGNIMILYFSMTLTDLLYWSGPIWFMLQYPINNCQHTSHDIIQVSIYPLVKFYLSPNFMVVFSYPDCWECKHDNVKLRCA